jgi:hypothetical protein
MFTIRKVSLRFNVLLMLTQYTKQERPEGPVSEGSFIP